MPIHRLLLLYQKFASSPVAISVKIRSQLAGISPNFRVAESSEGFTTDAFVNVAYAFVRSA